MSEKREFQTEVAKLLDIVINSLYSEKYIFLTSAFNLFSCANSMNFGNQNEPDADAILVKMVVLYAEYIANNPPKE